MTIVLPVYLKSEELLELTRSAVESFGKATLIIIDNGSPLGGGYLRSIADIYIRNQENLGYAKAVNQGLKLSKDEFIAIANNDVRVSPNWQEVAFEILEKPDVYSCHFKMIDYEDPMVVGEKTWLTGKERWCSSSFFVIKSSQPLLYDEEFLNSYDDWDYWFRVRTKGLCTAYTNKAVYQHKHSSTSQIMPEREKVTIKNREYFKTKWGEYPEELFTKQFPEQMKINYWEGFE